MNTVSVPIERLREWMCWLRREAAKMPLDSALRDTLWDLSTVIAEEVPAESKRGIAMTTMIYESDPYQVWYSPRPSIFHYMHKDGNLLRPYKLEDAWVLRRLIDESAEARRPYYVYANPANTP